MQEIVNGDHIIVLFLAIQTPTFVETCVTDSVLFLAQGEFFSANGTTFLNRILYAKLDIILFIILYPISITLL
jgi:hypothetical protein